MCGLIGSTRGLPSNAHNLLSHRGPDERYSVTFEGLSIDFFRLSITGDSAGSHPVDSPSGRWSVFINGEIYNYKSLIKSYDLAETTSDVRVIALGLDAYGIEFTQKLRGMYAGVIIDRSTHKIYALRDFFGEKPLFFCADGKNFMFSSEFRAMLGILERPLSIDPIAFASYARFGYVEEPWTPDIDIRHIPKGALSEISAAGVKVVLEIPSGDENSQNLPSLIQTLLTESMNIEVPGGLALSGGLDSSTLLSFCKKNKNRPKAYILILINIQSHVKFILLLPFQSVI